MPLAIFALAGLVLTPQATKYSLDWRPSLGQTFQYQLSMKGQADGTDIESDAKLRVVVKGATHSHGFALLCAMTDRHAKGGDQEAGDLADVNDVWLESDSQEDPDADKLDDFDSTSSLLVASYADDSVKIGDTWTQDVNGETQHYKLEPIELVNGTPALKVTMNSGPIDDREQDTYWFRVSDRLLLRAEQHTSGKTKDTDGKEYPYDTTYTLSFQSENKASTKPTVEDLKVVTKVGPQLSALAALTNPAQTNLANYDLTVHEFRDVRVLVLTPKAGISGMTSDGAPKGSVIECEVSKDGKRVSTSVISSDSDNTGS